MAGRDRQVFEVTELANGVTIYGYPTDDPFVIATILIPVGTAYNTGEILPGSFHFLEHCLCNRNAVFPGMNELSRKILACGGSYNATTRPFQTEYWVSVPTGDFPQMWQGLFARVFQPLIAAEDLPNERAVVLSEAANDPWYPGSDDLTRYVKTQVIWNQRYPQEQIFGRPADLAQMDVAYLATLSDLYAQTGVFVTIGGSYQEHFDVVCELLGGLTLEDVSLPFHYEPMRWLRRDFHFYPTSDVGQPMYLRGGFVAETCDWSTVMAARFVLDHLTMTHLGPFYRWLRDETGWAYSVDTSVSYDAHTGLSWDFRVYVPSLDAVTEIRAVFADRFYAALNDQDTIVQCLTAHLGSCVFDFQKTSQILSTAENKLMAWGVIGSEADYAAAVGRCLDRTYRLQLAERFFLAPNAWGDLCAIPKEAD